MQFIILITCCAVLPLSLSAYVYENDAIENIEQKLNALEQDLELMKQQETMEPISPTRQDDEPTPGLELDESWSDPVLFKKKEAFHEETTYQEEPSLEKVLLYTKDVEATIEEVVSMGGKVNIQLGNDLVIAKIPQNKVGSQHLKTASTHIPKTASPQTLSYVNAYWKNIQTASMEEQPKIHKWTDKIAPMAFHRESPSTNEANQRSTMTGKLAAIVLIVSGPGDLAMSDNEVISIKAEVMDGVQFWTDQAPSSASLSILVISAVARITVTDSTSCSSSDFALCHDRFAIPTIKSIGGTKLEDIEEYVLQHSTAVGAFTVFISKYKQSHFAYAYFGGGPIYMQYSNGKWGPDQIDRVYAHEIGHVFNSPDEYRNCNCNTRYGKGLCTERNANCDTCTASQVDCIMDTNNFKLCQYTKKHIGWCE